MSQPPEKRQVPPKAAPGKPSGPGSSPPPAKPAHPPVQPRAAQSQAKAGQQPAKAAQSPAVHPPAKAPPARPAAAATDPFDLGQLGTPGLHVLPRKKANPQWQWQWLAMGGAAVVIAVVVVVALLISGRAKSIVLRPVADREVKQAAALRFAVAVEHPGIPDEQLEFALRDGPPGAAVTRRTGEFSWTPTLEQAPGAYPMTVRVAAAGAEGLSQERRFTVRVLESILPPVITPIGNKTVVEASPLNFTVAAKDPNTPPRGLKYQLFCNSRVEAKIDAATGEFRWTPDTSAADKSYRFDVRVSKEGGFNATQSFEVRVTPSPTVRSIARLVSYLRGRGAKVEPVQDTMEPPQGGKAQIFSAESRPLVALQYESAADAEHAQPKIPPDRLRTWGITQNEKPPLQVFRSDRLMVLYVGEDAKLIGYLREHLGTPLPAAKEEIPLLLPEVPSLGPEKPAGRSPAAKPGGAAQAAPSDDDPILAMYDAHRLLLPTEYPTLRRLCAVRFEKQHAAEIRKGYGPGGEETIEWLNAHAEVKEEFYTAIHPQLDKIPAALGLFQEIRKQFPNKILPYYNLAIALAVVWDDEKRGVYDYVGHQKRVRSTLPENRLGAIENFKYLVDAERLMQGRIQFLPWEFLVHVVNHRTPLAERQWAMTNYLGKRVMFGKCYKDVPYDMLELNSEDKQARLNDKEYNLPNLHTFGGVCALQADYAARVGKSIGVPAAYVGGQSSFGEGHAWVMWVELIQANRNSIKFSLESEGRYRGDHYYVGHLTDPQTGQGITDRELELRLHVVGNNPAAKRQAALAMSFYPTICAKRQIDVGDQLAFLNQVIRLCPGNENAWIAVAKICKEGGITKERNKQMMLTLDSLFRTFAQVPDFTWKVFDDLVSFLKDNPHQRIKLYDRLVQLYEQAGRPDLACEARLKLSDYLAQEKRQNEAIEGLAMSIKKFVAEGRYVPRMLDKLEAICKGDQGKQDKLLLFYKQFLPLIPRMRGDRPSPYCMQMYERGIDRFTKGGQTQVAQLLETELAKLKAAKPTVEQANR